MFKSPCICADGRIATTFLLLPQQSLEEANLHPKQHRPSVTLRIVSCFYRNSQVLAFSWSVNPSDIDTSYNTILYVPQKRLNKYIVDVQPVCFFVVATRFLVVTPSTCSPQQKNWFHNQTNWLSIFEQSRTVAPTKP